jgi:hypothetical protein
MATYETQGHRAMALRKGRRAMAPRTTEGC